ncbi:hypothetical protein N0V90_013005 [Kalmusia sp. IMI 367209]|nr:hypothetical protein N0V90_013005 [Kalmusia sp. IMI 367209]
MADVQAQPIIDHQLGHLDREDLASQLDELLEQYLHTLDAYQKAQQQLSKHLSSGYMSLAQANFNNAAHTRYGQDYYDERMQASRQISLSGDEKKTTFSIKSPAPGTPEPQAESSPLPKDDTPETKESHTDKETESTSSDATGEKTDTSQSKIVQPTNPIRWFGVLVPPALRVAQTSFVSAVEGPVLELPTLVKGLKQQEIEIGRLRKQIKKL